MFAEVVDLVIGGDTHKDNHYLAMVSPAGVPTSKITIADSVTGYATALRWITERAGSARVVIGLEGTRSYGIGLCRAFQAAGYHVVEVERPRREERRRGKTDEGDARLAALSVLRMDADRAVEPRADGPREALRILMNARSMRSGSCTRTINALYALLLTGTQAERQLGQRTLDAGHLVLLAEERDPLERETEDLQTWIRRDEISRLAAEVIRLGIELRTNNTQIQQLVDQIAPTLTDLYGVGPISAAQAIMSYSHHGRCRNEAAFAALAGANPIPMSSGRSTNHRLNRGGDRQLNRALHTIAMTRARSDDRTRAYIARRTTEGTKPGHIRRVLKRYIARELFRTLESVLTP